MKKQEYITREEFSAYQSRNSQHLIDILNVCKDLNNSIFRNGLLTILYVLIMSLMFIILK